MITETNVNIAIQESLNTLSRWKAINQHSNSRIIAQFNSVLKNNIIRCCSGSSYQLKQEISASFEVDCEFDHNLNLIDIHIYSKRFGDNKICNQLKELVKIKNIKEQPEVSNINFSSILNIQFNGK